MISSAQPYGLEACGQLVGLVSADEADSYGWGGAHLLWLSVIQLALHESHLKPGGRASPRRPGTCVFR